MEIRNNVFDLLGASKPSATSWSDHLQAMKENNIELSKENRLLKEENKKLKEQAKL